MIEERTAIGDTAVRKGISGVELDCALIQLKCELVRSTPVRCEELSSAQVVLVRIDVGRRNVLDRLLFIFSENYPKCRDDARGDFILNCKNIFQLSIVSLCPEL